MQINVSRVATLSGVTVMSKFFNDAKILIHNMRTFVELLHVARFYDILSDVHFPGLIQNSG